MNQMLTADDMIKAAAVNIANSIDWRMAQMVEMTGLTLSLRVWDGDNYYGCARLVDEDGPHVGRVRFTCGKCRDGILAAPGDVCEFCWCVAVEVEKIGETVNIRRPMRFESTGRAGGKTAAAAAFSGVKF